MGSSGTGAFENLIQLGLNENTAHALDDLIAEGYFPPEGYPNEVVTIFGSCDQDTLNNIIVQYKSSDFGGVSDFWGLLRQVAQSNLDTKNIIQSNMQQEDPYSSQANNYQQQDEKPQLNESDSRSQNAAPRQQEANSDRLQKILARTGYKFESTSGQKSYGPAPMGDDFRPPKKSQCYFGKIPMEWKMEDLIELFEKAGTIYHMRLMMNPHTGKNQTYGFVTYTDAQSAQNCVQMFNGYDCHMPGTNRTRKMIVNISEPNCRLFVGPVPKAKSKEDIWAAFSTIVEGISDVIVTEPAEPGTSAKNKGFCFLDFADHKLATQAKKRLDPGTIPIQSWRNFTGYGCEWADPLEEPDESVMAQVKNLYITKLTESVTESDLQERFSQYGSIERTRKVNNYAFVHFHQREDCMRALEAEDGKTIKDSTMKVALAKPVTADQSKNRLQKISDRRSGGGDNRRGDGFRGGRGDRGGFNDRGRGGGGGGGGYMDRGYGDYGYAMDDYGYEQYPPYDPYGYGYDSYGPPPDPYGAPPPAYPPMRGGGRGGYGNGGGYGPPPTGGFGSGGRGRGDGGFGGRGGAKRPYGSRGGPPPKRGRGSF